MKCTEQVLREHAKKASKSITIRSYEDGNSKDETRKPKEEERTVIEKVIYGGLLAIKQGADEQSVADTCEYIGKLQLPQMNGYDTIYLPLKKIVSAIRVKII